MSTNAASSCSPRLLFLIPASMACILALPNNGLAQLPATRLDSVFPAGGAPSSTLELTLAGTNLDDVDQLHFSHPGITAARKMAEPTPFDDGPQPVENTFVVTIAADVPPGTYDIRCQGKYGRSNRRTFEVGAVPEFVEKEPNGGNDLPAWVVTESERTNLAQEVPLPAMINGQAINGPDVDWYRFTGKAGQRILLEGFCRRIDSRMDLAMTVMTAGGQILGESRAGAARDSIVDVTLPADGEYFVKVHDALFAQGPGFVYRILIAQKPYIDFIFPPTGVPGTETEYTVYGRNLPGGQPSSLQIDGRPLEQVNVRIAMPGDVRGRLPLSTVISSHQAGLDGVDYRLTSGTLTSNSMLVVATEMTTLREAANDDPLAPQQLTLPAAVAGQFFPQRDVDWYQFEAKKDEEWIIDILSQRLGGTSDPALLVQQIVTDDKGETTYRDLTFIDDVQERNFNNRAGRHEFDERSGDPTYAFKAPADGKYRLMLRDGISAVRSDPRLVYQLEIRKAKPDFRLVAIPSESCGSLMLRKGGRSTIHLVAFRNDGFSDEIRVSATGMPEGVTADEVVIGPGNEYGTLVLTASDAAKGVGTIQVTGKALVNGAEVTRTSRYGTAVQSFQFNQPNANLPSVPARLVSDLQVCVSESEVAPQVLTIGMGDGKVLEMSRGGVLKIPYSVRRADGSAGNLTGFPINFPPNTNAQLVNIGAAEKGEFELRFQSTTVPGTYSIFLAGFNQGMQYRRNPELAEKAKLRQERIGKILMDAQQKTQQLTPVVPQRQTELTQATNQLTQATTAKQQADQKLTAAQMATQQAEAQLKQKTEQSAANPADESLKAQVTQAQTTVDAAKKAAEEAKTAVDEAQKKFDEATAAKKTAEDARAKAQMELTEAQQFQQRAQQEKQRADQFVNQKLQESSLRAINADVPSNPIQIRIVEFPIKLDSFPEALTVNQGEKVELAASISRMFEFNSQVSIQVQAPGGVAGLSFPGLNIPDGQVQGKVEIMAQANATPGTHDCPVRIQMNFNGQNLVMDRRLKLTVNEVKKQ
ncbi:MAG: hypothetical protein U0996_14850 [Planctomycetaceae bacterium]